MLDAAPARSLVLPRHDDIAARYRRIIRAARWAACLSHSEAASCLERLRAGDDYAGEAVNHFGGTRAVVSSAIKARGAVRSLPPL